MLKILHCHPRKERFVCTVDFEEFMIYMGEELLFEYIKNCWDKKKPLDEKNACEGYVFI